MHEHPRVRRHELRSGYGSLSPLLTQQTGRPWLKQRRIEEILASRPYDVMHFHNTSLLGPKALELRPRGRKPVKLYTTHEHWLICPMHVLWKFDGRPCDRPQCLECVIRGKRPPQIWRYTGLLDRTARHVDAFVSPSRFTARMHADRGFPQHVGHLPYFIDRVDGDWQNPRPKPHEKPYFLFVGRLELIKGLQTLIECWKRHAPAQDLLIAGAGAYENELRLMAAGVPGVRFLGPRSQEQLAAYYYHALALLVPSITYETFGIVIVEAFARKTPAIVRDLGALPEVIHDSGGGFVYRTEEELLSAMQALAGDPGARAELGERGYSAFVRWWSREAHMKLYFGLLDEIASRKYGRVSGETEGQRTICQHS
jgi:glycosyltransferase involved in cell wall biosynthesis